ncbi:g6886 [Coccomyxa elongata]
MKPSEEELKAFLTSKLGPELASLLTPARLKYMIDNDLYNEQLLKNVRPELFETPLFSLGVRYQLAEAFKTASAGSSEINEKVNYIFEDVKTRKDREQTIKVVISAASDTKRKLVQDAIGLRIVPSLVPISEPSKRQRIEQEFAAAAIPGSTSIRRFVWTGHEDSNEEVERMMLRIRALIGWDEFPPDLEQRDIHTEMLFNARFEHGTPNVDITGKSDISLQHAGVEPGCYILDDIQMLTELKIDLSTAALLTEAEAKAYMQYVAFHQLTGRHVPVLLTDGNIHVLYIYNRRRNDHQRLYWSFDNILDAAIYLEALVKKLAAANPAPHGYDPNEPDDADAEGDAGMRDLPPDYHEHSPEQPSSEAGSSHAQGTPSVSDSHHHRHQQSVYSSELRDAELQEALRLARFHPVVANVYGLPSYPKPQYYDLPLYP